MNLLEAMRALADGRATAVRCPTWAARYHVPVEVTGLFPDGRLRMAPTATPEEGWSYCPTVDDLRSEEFSVVWARGILVFDDPHEPTSPEKRQAVLDWYKPVLLGTVDGLILPLDPARDEAVRKVVAMLKGEPAGVILDVRDVIQAPTPYVPACTACGITALGSYILARQLAADGIEGADAMPCCDGIPKVCGCGEDLEKRETMAANTTDPAYHVVELTCPAKCGLSWYEEDGVWCSETFCVECGGDGGWDEDCWSEKSGHYTRRVPCALCSPEKDEGPDPEPFYDGGFDDDAADWS